jgi:methyl-accepting chemotaxis protein
VTNTVKKTAGNAVHAREAVGNAKEDAEKTGAVVREAVDAMRAIDSSSKQISQIIGVIDEIAFQTNLLALNAGVEAARAGEAGRGFAVVASEVRALAQRSAQAAKEIKVLILTSGERVEQGAVLVARAGDALQRIVTKVLEIAEIVGGISASAQEQSVALEQINKAIVVMDQVTQSNAAMVEETTAAVHNLSQETEELGGLVAKYKLSSGRDDGLRDELKRVAPHAFREAPPAPRRTSTQAGAPAGRAASKPAAKDSKPRAKAAAGSDESWDEF